MGATCFEIKFPNLANLVGDLQALNLDDEKLDDSTAWQTSTLLSQPLVSMPKDSAILPCATAQSTIERVQKPKTIGADVYLAS